MFSPDAELQQGRSRHASAARRRLNSDELDVLVSLPPTTRRPLTTAAADDDRGAVLVVVEHGIFILAALRSMRTSGALMSSRVDRAERRLQQMMSTSLSGSRSAISMSNTSMPANFLNSTAFAFHHRLAVADRSAPAQHGGAVGDDADQVARGWCASFGGSDGRPQAAATPACTPSQVALVGMRLVGSSRLPASATR